MTDFKFSCPSCGRHLQADSTWGGSQITCPACKAGIVIPQQSVDAAAPTQPAAAQKKLSRWPVLIAVLLLACGATAGWWFYFRSTGEPASAETPALAASQTKRAEKTAPEPATAQEPSAAATEPREASATTYLPPDAEVVGSVRVAALWKSPLLQKLVATFKGAQAASLTAEIKEKTGFAPEDVEAVYFGLKDLGKLSELASKASGGIGPGQAGVSLEASDLPQEGLIVIQTTKELADADRQKIVALAKGAQEAKHSDKTYYRAVLDQTSTNAAALYFPNPTMIVLGPEAQVVSAIDRETNAPPAKPELDFLKEEHSLSFVIFTSPGNLGDSLTAPAGGGTDPVSLAMKKLDSSISKTSYASGANFLVKDSLRFQMRWFCRNKNGATDVAAAAQDVFAQAKTKFAEVLAALGPGAGQTIQKLLDSAKTTARGNNADLVVAFPSELFEGQALAGLMMSAAMMGGRAGLDPGMNPGMPANPRMRGRGRPAKRLNKPAQESAAVVETVRDGMNQRLSLSSELPVGWQAPEGTKALFASLEISGLASDKATTAQLAPGFGATSGSGEELDLIKSVAGLPEKGRSSTGPEVAADEKGAVRLQFLLKMPAGQLDKISRFEGAVHLVSGGTEREVWVERPLGRSGSLLEDPSLLKAGVRVKFLDDPANLPQDQTGKHVYFEMNGAPAVVRDVALVDASGRRVETGWKSSDKQGQAIYDVKSERLILPQTRLKIVFVLGEKPTAVPFKFENIALRK